MKYIYNHTAITFVVGEMELKGKTFQPFDDTTDEYKAFFKDVIVNSYVEQSKITIHNNPFDPDFHKFIYFRDIDGNPLPSYGVCKVCLGKVDLWTGAHVDGGSTEHCWIDNIRFVAPSTLAITTDHSSYENGTWNIGG